MRVVVLGCGRMGAMLASRLSASGSEVVIIDQDASQFQRLSSDYAGKKIVGNGTEQDTLRRSGLANADVFVAITQGDNRNIMASEIARVIFNVPRVYTRIKDPNRADAFGKCGLQTFCTTSLAACFVEGLILNPVTTTVPPSRQTCPDIPARREP
jgi:trk system potassium uptake protein